MLASIISALTDSLLKSLAGMIQAEIARRGLIQQGHAQQALAETGRAESAQAAIAQAVADSPKSKDAALARLKYGTA